MTDVLINGEPYYITEEELTAYATARGKTLTADQAVLITQASDYFESLRFKGFKTDINQPFQFPRKCLYIDCQLLDSETIPQLVKDAICEIAIAIDAGNSPISTVDRATKSETVDVISVTYMDSASSTATVRAIGVKLNKILASGTGGNFVDVHRA